MWEKISGKRNNGGSDCIFLLSARGQDNVLDARFIGLRFAL